MERRAVRAAVVHRRRHALLADRPARARAGDLRGAPRAGDVGAGNVGRAARSRLPGGPLRRAAHGLPGGARRFRWEDPGRRRPRGRRLGGGRSRAHVDARRDPCVGDRAGRGADVARGRDTLRLSNRGIGHDAELAVRLRAPRIGRLSRRGSCRRRSDAGRARRHPHRRARRLPARGQRAIRAARGRVGAGRVPDSAGPDARACPRRRAVPVAPRALRRSPARRAPSAST